MSHQTFWKPQKQEKAKPRNSLQNRRPKGNKAVPEWKRGILSHHVSNPSKSDRAEFPREVVAAAIERSGGKCQRCRVNTCTTTHHVWGRGRGGRGVLSNAFRVCGICHIEIESNNELKEEIIEQYRQLYGDHFYFDQQDWEDDDRKQAAIRTTEEEEKQRMERINPVIELLSAAVGRKLKAGEIRLIDGMDDREVSVFAKLMADVVSAGASQEKHQLPFGFGYFDD